MRPALEILLTTGTVASARLLEKRLPPRARHQFVPVDLPEWVGRFLDHWRPDHGALGRIELWPNLVLTTHAREIPMMLVSGRLSARSYPALAPVAGTNRPDARSVHAMPGSRCGAGRAPSPARRPRCRCGRRPQGGGRTAAGRSGAIVATTPKIGSAPAMARRQHPSGEEEIAAAAHRRLAAETAWAVDDHRAAASRAR